MNDDWGSLSLGLHDYDADPHGDFLGFNATVTSNGFAGRTPFWVSRADIDQFVQGLADLDRSLHGSAELVSGAGDQEYIRVRLASADGSGRLLVSVEITEGPGESAGHRVQVRFRVMPNALTAFRRDLRLLLENRAPGTVRLLGDREAAG